VNSGGDLSDYLGLGIMLNVGFITCFLQGCELNGPEGVFGSLVDGRLGLASPEGVDQVFDTDETLLAEELFNDDIVRDGLSFVLLGLQISSLADQVLHQLLRGVAVRNVVLNRQKGIDVLKSGHDKRAIVNLLQAKFFQDLLSLRGSIAGLLDSDD